MSYALRTTLALPALFFVFFGANVGASTSLAAPGSTAFESEKLGIHWLRDLKSTQTLQWVGQQNTKAKNYVSLDSQGQPDAFYAAVGARFKEIAPNNAPTPVETALGKILQKAGGLVLIDAQGVETVLAPKITHADGSGFSAIAEFKVSPDETKVLYSYVKNGTDLNNWYVADLTTKQTVAGPFAVRLNDANWAADSKGIYYTDWDNAADLARGVRLTRNFFVDLKTGTQELVFQPPQKGSREFYAMDDAELNGVRYLIAYRTQGPAEVPLGLYIGRVGKAKGVQFQVGRYAWKPVRTPIGDRLGKYIGSEGSKLFIRSSEIGNGFGVVAVDLANTLQTKTVIPARKNQVLNNVQRVGDKLLLQYFSTIDFKWTVEVANFSGKIQKVMKLSDVGLLDVGMISPFVAGKFSKVAHFTFSEMRVPPTTLKLDLTNLKLDVLPSAAALPFDGNKIKYELQWVKSADGTMVPVEIFTRKDIAKPTFGYLFYYGYIGISQFSSWNRKLQVALDMGAAVAMVHHRGGGELGRDWQMSVKVDRLKSYQDTAAAGRWMRANLGLDKLAVGGRSFGGMHTMGLLAHYGDEFDAYIPTVPVSDVNEFLSEGTFGYYAGDDFGMPRGDWGTPLDTADWRNELAKWSPLANISKMTTLKPTMVFTADNDERVDPWQAYYFAEALNQKFPGNNLVFLYQEKFNGHNARTEFQDEMAFIAKTFGISTLTPVR